MTTIEELRHMANCLADSADEALLLKAADELAALQKELDELKKLQLLDVHAICNERDTLRTQNAELREALDGLVQECDYSASSGLPFNFPDGKGHWTQLEIARKALAQTEVKP